MKLASLALALGLFATSCVDAPTESSAVEQALSADCLGNFPVAAPMPSPIQWNGTLPPAVSSQEVWVIMARDLQGASWGFYQVDLVKRVVTRAVIVPAQSKPAAMSQLGGRIQPAGGVRFPPPGGGGPIGDGWRMAQFLHNTAVRMWQAADQGLAATPPVVP